jgi:hypothetical protein
MMMEKNRSRSVNMGTAVNTESLPATLLAPPEFTSPQVQQGSTSPKFASHQLSTHESTLLLVLIYQTH